jgi:hypothetical protein
MNIEYINEKIFKNFNDLINFLKFSIKHVNSFCKTAVKQTLSSLQLINAVNNDKTISSQLIN